MKSAPSPLIQIITSPEDHVRHQSLESICQGASAHTLLQECAALQQFWPQSRNLYHRVRALFFLSAIHRYFLPPALSERQQVLIPFEAYRHFLERRFVEAIERLLSEQAAAGPSPGISSALAQAYHELAIQTLADQVRHSVRHVRGNQWMFRVGHPHDHPLRIRPTLLERDARGVYPLLAEKTAVRMDFSHSGWSDIFFLGMDFPAGARVINASIDLGVRGRDLRPQPPIETYLRVIAEPVLRLVSVDLGVSADVHTIPTVFDFAQDYLGLLKAAVIAAGIVPPGMEGCEQEIRDLLSRVVGPGLGLEVVSQVNGIPKGSRLAVSTNLLGSLISICMRATGQIASLTGPLAEADRRIVAARAILGEWIGGSGGGWQDSGGLWPGIKLITGAAAGPSDPEHGVSRGRLLPNHQLFGESQASAETRQKLQESLVLVHGGMAQNVGPILEMVTEKYLLRSPAEWSARQQAMDILDQITAALAAGEIRQIGRLTHRNFFQPLQTIIPWCHNLYTQTLVEHAQHSFGDKFWGFWMLGGMAGGGMGFIFDPTRKTAAQEWLQQTMVATKQRLQSALPFAMEPVVYDFAINDQGTCGDLLTGDQARLPNGYYVLMLPQWLRADTRSFSPAIQYELARISRACRDHNTPPQALRTLLARVLPTATDDGQTGQSLDSLLAEHGFDREFQEQIRADLRAGRIGLAHNRLPLTVEIEDVRPDDVIDVREVIDPRIDALGRQAIEEGRVAVVTLAAGVGSRWTEGAGVVKALHPFCQFDSRFRSFLEVHLAKSRQVGRQYHVEIPHVVTTGYLTHVPVQQFLSAHSFPDAPRISLSPGRAVGLRIIPMTRDLQFAWEEMPQQILDEQQQKMRSSLRAALLAWARDTGEACDYTDNVPLQCLHPVGHWYEISNMLRNGVLADLLRRQPQLQHLMLHNIDTLGVTIDAGMLGTHLQTGSCLTFEVIDRRLEDRGGGLARVDGHVRLLEGLALPREEDEFALSYYNSMTTWIDIDQVLRTYGISRQTLCDADQVDAAVRRLSHRMPTYITIKDVKKRWGHGQEDIFPVTQFEKLWSDMTALREIDCSYLVVPLFRGQQLKEQAQLDGWLRDGSADYVSRLCCWD